MPKRKTLDSECEEKHTRKKEKHIENSVEAIEKDMSNISGKEETDMENKKCVTSSNNNLEDTKGNDLDTLLRTTHIVMIVEKEDDISRSTDDNPKKKYGTAAIVDSSSTELKSTSSVQTKCAHQNWKNKSIDTSFEVDVPNSLQVVQDHFSADVLSLLSIAEMDMIKKNSSEKSFNDPNTVFVEEEEGLSKSADADVVKQSDVTPDIYSNSNDIISINSKQYKNYSKRMKNKSSDTNSVACPSLPVAQDCTSTNTSSLSRIAEMGSLRKISDETALGDNLTSLVEKENSALMGAVCADSNRSGMLPEINSNSDIVKNNSNGHKETENKGKKVLDFSQYNLELDRNPSAINPSLSEDMVLNLVGKKNVDESIENNLMLNIDPENGGITKSVDDTSPSESSISFEMASNSYHVEVSSIQTGSSKEKEPDKTLHFSSCSVEHVPEDAPDAVLQVIESGIADDSSMASASEEIQRLRDKKVKNVMHERRVSNDAIAHDNEGLLDELHKVPQASSISAEGNLKALSTDCREPPSPIRGVMHDSALLNEPNKKNDRLDSSREEEVSFSFQLADKCLMNDSSDNHSEKVCVSWSGVGSDNVSPTTLKDDALNSTSTCIHKVTTKGQEENEVASLSMSHTAENVFSSDVINIQGKKLEAVTPAPEGTLVSPTRKKLLVLDLNGLLADIVLDIRNAHKAQIRVGGKSIFKRPFCNDFLKFCFERFDIGIWSSRRKYNVDSAVNFLMGDTKHKLLFCWDQSKCTYTGFRTLENVHKPLVLKELKKLWNKEETDLPWEKGDYSPSNTLLVDDSPYKALCNPPHTAIFPYPYHFDDENDTSLGPGGDLRVYLEGLAVADDVQHYVQEHSFGQQAITTSDTSWNFYLQVIEKVEKSLAPTQ